MSEEFAGNDKAFVNGYVAAIKEFRDTFNNTGGYCNSVSIPLINQKCDSMLKKIIPQDKTGVCPFCCHGTGFSCPVCKKIPLPSRSFDAMGEKG